MIIGQSQVGKVCHEQEPAKYLPITSESLGYAKLCCYAVKFLQDNNIFASYENICVALWRMFPKCERLHLAGYDDMPDTDYMEKLIKLRSTPKNQNYLSGGNFQGKRSEYGYEWRLTTKGEAFAEEVEEILKGPAVRMARESAREGTMKYENIFKHLWSSKLWTRFEAGDTLDKVPAIEIASALDFLYSSLSFPNDLREVKSYYEKELKKVENEKVSDPRIKKTWEFLKKFDHYKVGGDQK